MGKFDEQQAKFRTQAGFIAALDQSGGSTPKALKLYGIPESGWSSEAEMMDLVHAMRTRIVTSPSFNGERILAAILFEATMDRDIKGRPTAEYLWEVKKVVPVLKVDKGLEADANGVQLMKPMPGLDALLARAKAKGIFGTKMRSVIKQANPAGIARSWSSSSRWHGRSSPRASCRSSSRRWTSTAPTRRRRRTC